MSEEQWSRRVVAIKLIAALYISLVIKWIFIDSL